jgi:hypothetical protein
MENKENEQPCVKVSSEEYTQRLDINSSPQDLAELLEPIVRKILADMLGVTQDRHQNPQVWFDTAKAYSLLDLADSEQLREMVRSGLLRLGKEVRDRRKPNSQKPRYQFNIERCKKRLLELPEKRI